MIVWNESVHLALVDCLLTFRLRFLATTHTHCCADTQAGGLDLQMNAYQCLSTGDFVGMLEVVMNAKTVADIQGACCISVLKWKLLRQLCCDSINV